MDDEQGTMFSSAFGGQYYKEKEPLPNINMFLECSLEELYNSCVKELRYQKKALNYDGRTTFLKDDRKDIEVFKGYDNQTILSFPGHGNEAPGQKTCNEF